MPHHLRPLLVYIMIAYVVQGSAEHFCLPAQPLENFLLAGKHWDAAQIAASFAVLMLPWTCKPIFGIASDMFFRAGRRMLLTLSFAIGAIGYLLALVNESMLMPGFLIAGCGLSWSTALLYGEVAARCREHELRAVLPMQAFAYYSALMAAMTAGGWLCHTLAPYAALRAACEYAALLCAGGAIASVWMLRESAESTPQVRPAWRELTAGILNKNYLSIAAFIFLWNVSPAFGTPLYVHYTKTLHLSQFAIGSINSCNSAGMLVGALIAGIPMAPKRQVALTIAAASCAPLLFLFVSDFLSAAIVEFARGVSTMLGIIVIYTMGAQVAKPRLETALTSLLIAVYNFGTQISSVTGGYLYVHVFFGNLYPLLFLSSAATAACILPWLYVQRLSSWAPQLGNPGRTSSVTAAE